MKLNAKNIAFLAIFTALIMLATWLIHIPSGIGYINFGDTFIFVAAVFFGPIFGLICGGVGSALADVLSGFAAYAPATLIIKGAEGLICAILFKILLKTRLNVYIASCISMAIAALIMVAGYFLTNGIFFGTFRTALVEGVPGDCIQALVSVTAGMVIAFSLSKSNAALNYIGENPFTQINKSKEDAEDNSAENK